MSIDHTNTKDIPTCNMLRLQLACALIFTLTLSAHAITPIHPLPENKDSHKITSSAPVAQGHITTPFNPAATVPETGSLSDFSSLVADAVSALQQKAEEAKTEFAPEIEKLKEKEQAAAEALHAAQAQAALKLKPELDMIHEQQDKLRSEASAAASILGREFKKVEPVIHRELHKVEDSVQPFASQLHGSVSDIARRISKSASDAHDKLQEQMPGRMQHAGQAIAAAEKALKEDLIADLAKLKPAAQSVQDEIQKKEEAFKGWFDSQKQLHQNVQQPQMHPWDAVEAEVRSDVERMGRMFSDQLQHLQQARSVPSGVQPPLKGGARIVVISRLPPTLHDQHPLLPGGMPMPLLPPFLTLNRPAGQPRAFRISLGVPTVTAGDAAAHARPEVRDAADGPQPQEKDDGEHEHGHGNHRHHGDHHGRGGRFRFGRWLRKHLGMHPRPHDQDQDDATDQQQLRSGVVVQLHSSSSGEQADSDSSGADAEDSEQTGGFRQDYRWQHEHRHGRRFAKCIFGIVRQPLTSRAPPVPLRLFPRPPLSPPLPLPASVERLYRYSPSSLWLRSR